MRLQAAIAIAGLLALPSIAPAQDTYEIPPLFASRELLTLTIATDLQPLMRDKMEDAPWREGFIAFPGENGETLRRPVRLRTRGLWRLRHCSFPPLRFNFVKDSVKGTVFARQDRPKLATHCRSSNDYEQWLLQEYLVYRVQEVLTPVGLMARLARITYVDVAAREDTVTRYAILLEDPDAMAERLGGRRIETKGIPQTHLDGSSAVILGLFQFMIGNTDWSVPGLHNIELVETATGDYLGVAYDYDWTGAIDARYAEPAATLGIRNVRQRLWRGICPDTTTLQTAIEHFQAQRPRVEAMFDSVPGLEPARARRMREYFGEFYDLIAEPRRIHRELGRACLNYQE